MTEKINRASRWVNSFFFESVYEPLNQSSSCYSRQAHKGHAYCIPPKHSGERTLKKQMVVCLNIRPTKIHTEEMIIWYAWSLSMVWSRPKKTSHNIKEYLGIWPGNQIRWCIEVVGLKSLRTSQTKSIVNLSNKSPF